MSHLGLLSRTRWSSAGRSFEMRSLNPCPENFDQIVVVLGRGVNYQTQIVTKLPNENIHNYQLEMFDSGRGGRGSKLPNAKWLRMTRNGQFCPIDNFSNLFPPKWPRMTWNGQFHPIRNFSNLFPLKCLRMTWNGQFWFVCLDIFHLVVWLQFAFGSLPLPPPQNQQSIHMCCEFICKLTVILLACVIFIRRLYIWIICV